MPTAESTSHPETRTVEPPALRKQRVPWETIAFAALAVTAFLVRLWPIWKVHFWDEAVYLQNAEAICCGKLNYSELSSRPPLLSLLFAVAFRVWHNVYFASLLVAALNTLGPLFLYLAGRKLVGKPAAGIAALLLAFSPFFVRSDTGNSLLTDSPALSLILVSLWLLVEAAERNRSIWFAAAGLVSAMAVLMRFASVPTIAVISLLLFRADRWVWAALRFGAGFALGIAPYLLWSLIRYGGPLATLKSGWANVAGSTEPATYYLTNFTAVFPWITLVGLALWIVALVRALKNHAPGSGSSLASDGFLVLWSLVMLAYFSSIAHKELRYIIPLAPPLFLLAGKGLSALVDLEDKRARIAGVVVLLAALGYSFAPVLGRFREPLISPYISEEKEISEFLDSHAPKRSVLYTNFNYPVFGYYTHLKTAVLIGGFYNAFPRNMPEDGFLVVYKQQDQEPTVDWLDSNPHFKRYEEFPSVVVYQYQVKGD